MRYSITMDLKQAERVSACFPPIKGLKRTEDIELPIKLPVSFGGPISYDEVSGMSRHRFFEIDVIIEAVAVDSEDSSHLLARFFEDSYGAVTARKLEDDLTEEEINGFKKTFGLKAGCDAFRSEAEIKFFGLRKSAFNIELFAPTLGVIEKNVELFKGVPRRKGVKKTPTVTGSFSSGSGISDVLM